MATNSNISTSRRKKSISRTMDSFKKDIAGAQASATKPPLEKIRVFIGKPVTLATKDIKTHENIRKELGEESDQFLKLKESIERSGILQSILVEVLEKKGDYELICVEGHRRLMAASELGLERVPCILQAYGHRQERTNAALAATIKEDIHPIDRAEAFAYLVETGMSVEQISEQHERDVRTVRRYLKMAKWSVEVKRLIREHKELFSTRFLFLKMAQADLNPNEIKKIVLDRIAAAEKEAAPKEKMKRRVSAKERRMVDYFKETLKVPAQVRMRSGRRVLEIDVTDSKVMDSLGRWMS